MKLTARKILMLLSAALLTSSTLSAATYTVTNTLDSGPGSLRAAILAANANAGVDNIVFAIPTGGGNIFESSGANSWAVIQISSPLDITEGVTINGATQTNTNTGSLPTRTVGVDGVIIPAINYPDVYIVPSATFSFPADATVSTGNGFNITATATGVSISGIAISGFGNTNTNSGSAAGHADITLVRSASIRTANATISNCFISCDPRGAQPAAALRRTKGNGILVGPNNESGTISNNYIAYSGSSGIYFYYVLDYGGPGTATQNKLWTVTNNQIITIGTTTTVASGKASDGITLTYASQMTITNNYIQDAEHVGIDIGFASDNNTLQNNTITGMTRSTAIAGNQSGIRITSASSGTSILKNIIFNNTATALRGGIWIDRIGWSSIAGKTNVNHSIQQNAIYGNNGSGITIANQGAVAANGILISQNSIYNNAGLGIDLNYTASIAVTKNDDGDADTGPNDLMNFPIIDSVRPLSSNRLAIYGKAPTGSTIEFFLNDGQNNYFGQSLNYGEGKTYLGNVIEGSASDNRVGLGSYATDGNNATGNVSLFAVLLNTSVSVSSLDSITSTATIGNNTSEFGPVSKIINPLRIKLFQFNAALAGKNVDLSWQSVSDADFLYFDLQHSSDGRNFTKISTIAPGELENLVTYKYVHTNPSSGNNFYRLRMVNGSGEINYSSVLRVSTNATGEFKAMNSFFHDALDLQLKASMAGTARISLVDAEGRVIATKLADCVKGQNFIKFSSMPGAGSGIYYLQAVIGNEVFSARVMRQ